MSTHYPAIDRRAPVAQEFPAQLEQSARGTRFGCGAATFTRSSPDMIDHEASSPCSPPTPRQRDRRRGFGELLATLARTIGSRGDTALLRGAFEEVVRRTLSVRSVHLRDATSRWGGRPDATAIESVAFEVPG